MERRSFRRPFMATSYVPPHKRRLGKGTEAGGREERRSTITPTRPHTTKPISISTTISTAPIRSDSVHQKWAAWKPPSEETHHPYLCIDRNTLTPRKASTPTRNTLIPRKASTPTAPIPTQQNLWASVTPKMAPAKPTPWSAPRLGCQVHGKRWPRADPTADLCRCATSGQSNIYDGPHVLRVKPGTTEVQHAGETRVERWATGVSEEAMAEARLARAFSARLRVTPPTDTTCPGKDTPRWCASAREETLLGSMRQFCSAFYHIQACYEGDLEEACLCPPATPTPAVQGRVKTTILDECQHKQVVCVARLQDARGRDRYVARYTNCFRGTMATNVHAEVFLCEDAVLAQHLQDLGKPVDGGVGGGVLTLYLTFQPCHYSSGRIECRTGATGAPSCTLRLLDWWKKQHDAYHAQHVPSKLSQNAHATHRPSTLSQNAHSTHRTPTSSQNADSCHRTEPQHHSQNAHATHRPSRNAPSQPKTQPSVGKIALRIKVVKQIYRAHWTDPDGFESAAHERFYGMRREAARTGLRLLNRPPSHDGDMDIGIGMADASTWAWLVQWCDAAVQQAWQHRRPPFTEAMCQARSAADAYFRAALAGILDEKT